MTFQSFCKDVTIGRNWVKDAWDPDVLFLITACEAMVLSHKI